MDKCFMHKKIGCISGKGECYLFTCSIPNASSIVDLNMKTENFEMENKVAYYVTVTCLEDKVTLTLVSRNGYLNCSASMFIGSKTLLLSKKFHTPFTVSTKFNTPLSGSESSYHYYLNSSSADASFQKLKQHANDALIIICRIKIMSNPAHSSEIPGNTSTVVFNNLNKIAAAFKNSSESWKEKIILRVGEESETVNKAILCSRSPVFAKMFKSNMQELRENTVTVTDIKMPVLKALISFLYSGKLPIHDVDFYCDLYYASDKYDIPELRQLCIDLLLPEISPENVLRILKLAFSHNIGPLKFTTMTFIAENIETWVSTNDWKNLLDNEPEIAIEIINFCDL